MEQYFNCGTNEGSWNAKKYDFWNNRHDNANFDISITTWLPT